jgi:hypothetical protein
MATGVSNVRYPLTTAQLRLQGNESGQGALATSVKEGGDQIEYADQDPRIHEIWLEEMKKNGVTPQFEKYATKL